MNAPRWSIGVAGFLLLASGAPAQVAGDAHEHPDFDAYAARSRDSGWTCGTLSLDPDIVYPAGFSAGAVWTGGVVPYRYDAAITSERRAAMEAALTHIASKTAVQFIPRTTQPDFVTIVDGTEPGTSFSSAVGRAGGEQFLRIAAVHWTAPGVLIHEMCHALGLNHEHQRSDRNSFVTVVSAKVNPTYTSAFTILSGTLRGIYDFASVMHYPSFNFSTDGDMTLEVRTPYRFWWQYRMGQGTTLSPGDIQALRALYPTPATQPTYFSLSAPADGALVGAGTQPNLSWSEANGAAIYRLVIARDRSLSNPVYTDMTANGATVETDLEPNRVYSWQAVAINDNGETPPHPVPMRQFYTASAYPATLYVDDSAPSTGTGLSWAAPLHSLQEALEVARSSVALNGPTRVTEIRVAGGTYTPDLVPGDSDYSFFLPSGVALVGGYAGYGAPDPDQRDIHAFETVLSADLQADDSPDIASRADNSTFVLVVMDTAAGTRLEGVTLRGARRVGLSIDKSIVTVRDCTIIDSRNDAHIGARGAEVLYGNSNATFERCRFINNDAESGLFGGGLGTFYRCSVAVRQCLFAGNGAPAGGGATVGNATGIFTNCVFIGNTSNALTGYIGGGAILTGLAGTSLRLNNCTIVDSRAAAGATALAGFDGVSTQMFNTIVRGSGSPLVSGAYTGTANNLQIGSAGTLPVVGNPLFRRNPSPGFDLLWGTADDDLGDLRLSVGSPCINTGSNFGVPSGTTTDFAGETRILGGTVDVGAFEFRCPADFNADGSIDPDDLGDFINCYFSMPPCSQADYNGDASIDPDDLGDFINTFFSGAC